MTPTASPEARSWTIYYHLSTPAAFPEARTQNNFIALQGSTSNKSSFSSDLGSAAELPASSTSNHNCSDFYLAASYPYVSSTD
ncbi:hypothetical protein NLI96_g11855 [Meripilus lineatus]|uniref:Uncharacterized protein n=1 Tax=Meripilus lineatus TaxID=2056292 RepID=A0AAD5UVX3_9APHY|nr:hypothetical protein NLI96_g11855 [Physisporinus lineatus]